MIGRPPKQNAPYFPHENSMRNDKKLKIIRARFGLEGYAIYNMLLESLAEADLIRIECNDMEIEMLAGDFGIDSGRLKELIDYYDKINLIKKTKRFIMCPQLDTRLKRLFDRRCRDLNELRANSKPEPAPPPRKKKLTESEKEILIGRFSEFYKKYPKHLNGEEAKKAWLKLNPDQKLFDLIMDALEQQIKSRMLDIEDKQFIPYPATWLNKKRWNDEIIVKSSRDVVKELPVVEEGGTLVGFDELQKRNQKKATKTAGKGVG